MARAHWAPRATRRATRLPEPLKKRPGHPVTPARAKEAKGPAPRAVQGRALRVLAPPLR
jgi:hypothetical protein